MCERCGGLMYREKLDNDSRCWICGRSTLTRLATKADARDSQHHQRVERGMDRWLDRLGIGKEGFAPKVGR